MKKILFVFSLMLIFNLSAEAYTYQWNVPYDNYGKVYYGNTQGGYYYGGKDNKSYQQNPHYNQRHHKKRKHNKHYRHHQLR